MVDAEYEIENIVLSGTYEDTEFDLEGLADLLENARYDPDIFPGIAYRSVNPTASFLIFASGKANCVGASRLVDAENANEKLTEELREAGVEIGGEPEVKVRNMVASFDFGREFDLETIARDFRNTEYEPEVFPGLVFRLDEPKVVVLLFVSGKGVCAGAKSESDIEEAAGRITEAIG
ncbi:hypothetical protein AKJ65_06225 [candidate division MSBL1 archaeon SCGC-AAA259E19]|uniref:TATA-box-binding protein n=1 Tax=candidate division MSBL1 archaeon SCGC-AAA259E19 TaxID=1698264 RepID=A0A133UH44_9EURY|nr:hypothetical protein AKJ65_06225 [candidate division MSBL1 archaeon SCGC-AAA259E19]